MVTSEHTGRLAILISMYDILHLLEGIEMNDH